MTSPSSDLDSPLIPFSNEGALKVVETSCGHPLGTTSWNKHVDALNFWNGDGGLAGCCYQVLHVEIAFNQRPITLTGFKTDMTRGAVS